MKLDKIRFARVIQFITDLRPEAWLDIEKLDEMIDVNVPVTSNKVACEDVNELLRQIAAPDGFLPAIKAYRVLTGAGLKESKESIEKYRSIPKVSAKEVNRFEAATLGDILRNETNNPPVNFDKFEG